MTVATSTHYDEHLGPIYSWMIGNLPAALEIAAGELDAIGLLPGMNATAVDLGAGFGLHSIPLAERGFQVTAIDGCQSLLEELQTRANRLPIRTVQADLLNFREHVATPVDVVLCMGDTVTHLPSHASVTRLFREIAGSLNPGGVFALTFRDYVSSPLQGDSRFILVRSDAQRILSCFLEYGEDTVVVHDLIHEKRENGWNLRVSSYKKLRLSPAWVIDALQSEGLLVHQDSGNGRMVRITARKPRLHPGG